jgi:hypothetical protein
MTTDANLSPEPIPQLLAHRMGRGVARALTARGFATLTEFFLLNGRRVDVIGINGSGQTIIVEIKSCIADYRSDQKWTEYLEYCDSFYFAVPPEFPQEILPDDCGLMVADDYGAEVIREAPSQVMNGSRRRAQMLRLALTAMLRLGRVNDPSATL